MRSRAALFCIAAISASAMSAGALSAAAYVDILPGGLQHVMHTVIGAPQPGESAQPRASSSQRPLTNPGATAMLALCRAWSAQSSKGPARQQSAAFAGLVAAAGGAVNVDAYCASVVATSTPTVRTPGPRPVSAGKAGLSPASPRGTTPHSTKPTRTEPAKTQPAKAQPAKAQSAKAHQAKAPTAETQARTAPAKAAPGTPTAASHSAAPARSRAQPMMSASGSHHP